MYATATATATAVARIAGVALVLTVAAALGLYAGTLINARDDAGAGIGAGGSALPHMSGFDGARQQHDAAIAAPADAAPVGPQAWGNIEAAPAPVGPQAWGNR